MMRTSVASGVLAVLVASSLLPAQETWSVETLEAKTQKFLSESWRTRLEQVAELIATKQALTSVQQAVHGDYREYLVKVRTLLHGLTNERWLERERAERTLIEVGGRARDLLRERAQVAETLEERDRVQRVLDQIEQRGTEEDDRRVKLLRGFVLTSLYMPTTDSLRKALVSALGHTDGSIIDHALRALGRHASEAEVPPLVRQVEAEGNPHRSAALAALARCGRQAAQAALTKLIDEGKLGRVEMLEVLRIVRGQEGSADIVARLAAAKDPLISTAAGLQLPAAQGGPTCEATLNDNEHTLLQSGFGGLIGDAVTLLDPVDGMSVFEAPFGVVAQVQFAPLAKPASARIFLNQGSLVTGTVTSIDADTVQVDNEILGHMSLPRAQVQGILFAPELDRLIGGSVETDRIRTADKALRDATVQSLTAQGLVVLGEDQKPETLPVASVAGILFRRPTTSAVDTTLYSRLSLRTGDRVLGHIVGATASHLAFVLPLPGVATPAVATVVPVAQLTALEFLVGGGASWGYTIIADYSDNKIVEVDEKGREVFVLNDVFGAWDVECLDNGNLLVTEFSVSRVQEVTRAGKVVWSFEDLKNPYDADRLPNGNTLIADTFGGRVIEVDKGGKVVWSFANDIRPFDCDRLANGNTLIADVLHERVIEVTRDGQIAWELRNMKLVHDADRLPNGNTLITLREAKKVIEVDRDGQVVFELKNLSHPSDADRLPNGNTLVAENGMVREFDRAGNEVWRKEMTWAVEANRY
ncbi:MAG: hypothetical protein R3F56_22830 [Planctomycetota bacterium]